MKVRARKVEHAYRVDHHATPSSGACVDQDHTEYLLGDLVW